MISASAGGYGNSNYIVDNVRYGYGYSGLGDYTTNGNIVSVTTQRFAAKRSSCQRDPRCADGTETYSNGVLITYPPHLTSATNVAGYISWGFHSSLGNAYATNGSVKMDDQ